MEREADFNRIASEEFAGEYERETGRRLRFKAPGDPFPDAILETCEGVQLGVEFVSVVLSFVRQEEAYFNKYRERFYEALRPARPRYQHAAIRLQPSTSAVEGPRPYKLPDVDGADGGKLVVEFRHMLAQHLDTLLETHGDLIERFTISGTPAFPTLSKYFGAIILNEISEHDPRKPHPEDPVIESVVVIYRTGELAEAVRRALAAKAGRGLAYATNLLVLHTLAAPGKPHFPGAAMNAVEIEALGRELLTKERDLCQRFDEIFFLNAYRTEDRRLYRLKADCPS